MLPEDPLTNHYVSELGETLEDDFSLDLVKTEIIEPSTFQAFDVLNLSSSLVFLTLNDRYNLLNCLENLKPSHIILYNVDIVATRLIEVIIIECFVFLI